MVKTDILTEVTPKMSTPEWLNSFVIMNKPNGNLRVFLDPTDLNKHITRPISNMRTLEEIIDDTISFIVYNIVGHALRA